MLVPNMYSLQQKSSPQRT